MEWGSLAGMITALATVITALGGLIVSIRVLIPNFKQTKEVHKVVNQQKTDMERYQKALIDVLAAHGIDIPVDQSKLDTGEH
jgi:hypothetical protein